jgi:hypothetical protein
MFAKRFFYCSAAILCLALAYHFGATSATAQAPGNPVVAFIGPGPVYTAAAITANGDVYATGISALDHDWTFRANIFGGGPIPVQQESFGSVKARYR